MEKIPRDKDSLEAMQSLLQIRTRGLSESSASYPQDTKDTKAVRSATSPHDARNKKRSVSLADTVLIELGKNKEQAQKSERVRTSPPQPSPQHRPSASHQAGLVFSSSPPSALSVPSPMTNSSTSMRSSTSAAEALAQVQLVAAQAAMAAAAASAVAAVSTGHQLENAGLLISNAISNNLRRDNRSSLLSAEQVQNRLVSPPHQQSYSTNNTKAATAANLGVSPVPSFEMDFNSKNSKNALTHNAIMTAAIRREKVEAALRSKPQRGKKRDDLSAKERLELTRTRNREHAKTTRIRKKARYQELVQCETRLKSFLQQEEAEALQRKAIETFLSLRQSMIRCCDGREQARNGEAAGKRTTPLGTTNASETVPLASVIGDKSPSPHTGNKTDASSPVPCASTSPSSVAALSSTTTTASATVITKPIDHASFLAQMVQDVNQFDLQVTPKVEPIDDDTTLAVPSFATPSLVTPAMKALLAMDRQIVDRAVERYGIGAQKYFVYRIVNGTSDGIALTTPNKSGSNRSSAAAAAATTTTTTTTTAMAEIELYMELSPCNRTLLQTSLIKVKFANPQSPLLDAVEWKLLQDCLSSNEEPMSPSSISRKGSAERKREASAASLTRTVSSMHGSVGDAASTNDGTGSPLQNQSVFPSIISLEQNKAANHQQEESLPSASGSATLGLPL